MSSKSNQNIVKTPIVLQLQKINLFNVSQQKNVQMAYHILRMLNQIVISNSQIVNTSIFSTIFNELLTYEQIGYIKMLPLYELFCFRLWNDENFNFQMRQKTSFYKIVSNWIVNFELKSGNLEHIKNQFELIKNFMLKQTNTNLERIVLIEETYEDLKELISEQFWKEEEIIKNLPDPRLKEKKGEKVINPQQQISEADLDSIYTILEVLETIVNPIFYRLQSKQIFYKNCTYGDFQFNNVKQFIKKTLYYILKLPNIPSHLQTQLSKIALIYMQSIKNSGQIVNLLKHLMLKTSKAVRFALVIEYVQFYEYLERMGFDEVIEQLEDMIYFRELIIGKRIVEESIMSIGNTMNDLNLSHHELYVKAGTSRKIFFSNQWADSILKLDILLQENDINIEISYFNSLQLDRKETNNLSKFIFEAVSKLNNYDASLLKGEKSYWKQEKSTSKKLQLKLNHYGLYCIEFDNSYSWVIPKNVRYRLEIYQPYK